MRILNYPRLCACAILATLALTGCAGNTPQPSPAGISSGSGQAPPGRIPQTLGSAAIRRGSPRVTTPSFMDPQAVAKPLLFVADYDTQTVDIYLQSGDNKLVGQITGLDDPYAVASDAERNVYVVNYLRLGVQVYAPPYTGGPAYSLDTGNYTADYVGVSSKGVVGVLNYCTDPNCYPNSSFVTFFPPHSTVPCATVPSYANVAYLEFGSFDRNGNFFTNGFDSNGYTLLGEIKGGCKAKTMTVLNAGNNDGVFGSIHVNKVDQPSIVDIDPPGSGPAVVYSYAQPIKGNLGNPVSTTMLQGPNRAVEVQDFTFQASGANLYLPDASGENIDEYAYPAGGAAERTIRLGNGHLVLGVAVTPPLLK